MFRRRDQLLHFEKPVFRGDVLFRASTNGLSELATSLVSGITTLLFNLAMLKYIGKAASWKRLTKEFLNASLPSTEKIKVSLQP